MASGSEAEASLEVVARDTPTLASGRVGRRLLKLCAKYILRTVFPCAPSSCSVRLPTPPGGTFAASRAHPPAGRVVGAPPNYRLLLSFTGAVAAALSLKCTLANSWGGHLPPVASPAHPVAEHATSTGLAAQPHLAPFGALWGALCLRLPVWLRRLAFPGLSPAWPPPHLPAPLARPVPIRAACGHWAGGGVLRFHQVRCCPLLQVLPTQLQVCATGGAALSRPHLPPGPPWRPVAPRPLRLAPTHRVGGSPPAGGGMAAPSWRRGEVVGADASTQKSRGFFSRLGGFHPAAAGCCVGCVGVCRWQPPPHPALVVVSGAGRRASIVLLPHLNRPNIVRLCEIALRHLARFLRRLGADRGHANIGHYVSSQGQSSFRRRLYGLRL